MKSRSAQVLLADDDPDDREFFCLGMKRLYPQISVTCFEDGAQLLDFLRDCPTPALPDCIFIDYKMPRLTGPELLMATGPGTRYSSIPKIIFTTTQRQKDVDECVGLGASHFPNKPATDSELGKLLMSLEVFFHPAL